MPPKHPAHTPAAPPRRPVERLFPDPAQGLSTRQAAARAAAGWANTAPPSLTKTTGQILRDNLFTFYNLVFLLLAGCLLAVGAFRDMLFLGVVAANAAIGILQELRVRAVLRRAELLRKSPVRAVRDGRVTPLPPEELVLDDVVLFSAGGQVCADGILLTGGAEVNESLLTGEEDPVKKGPGDALYSGSVLTAGACTARLTAVGADSCAARLTQTARRQKRRRTGIAHDLDRYLRAVGAVLLPFGLLMGWRQLGLPGAGVQYAVSSTVAALCGMIPEGLYLLVSVALAVGVLRLARQRTLVHEMACIENLARVDTLCLDKTGTLTTGSLRLEAVLPVGPLPLELLPPMPPLKAPLAGQGAGPAGPAGGDGQSSGPAAPEPDPRLAALLGGFARAAAAPNATLAALSERFEAAPLPAAAQVPFSSERKWSAQWVPANALPNAGLDSDLAAARPADADAPQPASEASQSGIWYLLGAPERLAPGQHAELLAPYLAAGRRVLAFAAGPDAVRGEALTGRHTLLCYLVLSDTLRPDAAATLRYFGQQGVTIKVLSGDAAATVGRVARQAGLPGADKILDLSAPLPGPAGAADVPIAKIGQAASPGGQAAPETAAQSPEEPPDWQALASQYTVFARVSPGQKRELIAALRHTGHTVAMLGDGVNDLPALKEADCSIAMAAGSEATRQASQIVLLDSDFAALPRILAEGRRVIQNVSRSASLFLIKNIFSFLTAAVLLLAALPYPLVPIQITLISGLLIGAPSFLLTFEPCAERVTGRFLPTAIGNALPGGLTAAGALLLVSVLAGPLGMDSGQLSSVCTLLAGINGLCALVLLCWPLTRLRAAVIGLMALGFFGAVTFLPGLFGIQPFTAQSWRLVWAVGAAIPPVQGALVYLIYRLRTRQNKRGDPT